MLKLHWRRRDARRNSRIDTGVARRRGVCFLNGRSINVSGVACLSGVPTSDVRPVEALALGVTQKDAGTDAFISDAVEAGAGSRWLAISDWARI